MSAKEKFSISVACHHKSHMLNTVLGESHSVNGRHVLPCVVEVIVRAPTENDTRMRTR